MSKDRMKKKEYLREITALKRMTKTYSNKSIFSEYEKRFKLFGYIGDIGWRFCHRLCHSSRVK